MRLVLASLLLLALAPSAAAVTPPVPACVGVDDVACNGVAVSVEGDATSCPGGGGTVVPCAAVAPHGRAFGFYGLSVHGESQAHVGGSLFGPANCGFHHGDIPFDNCHSVSGTGDTIGATTASGTGDAWACRTLVCAAASGTGNADSGNLAASGTGDARGLVAVSGTGHASCNPLLGGHCVALSGCDTLAAQGRPEACFDPA